MLKGALEISQLGGDKFDVIVIKARDVITDWAARNGRDVHVTGGGIAYVNVLQDLGDEMRGAGDHAAVAKEMVRKLRQLRAERVKAPLVPAEPVKPDGKPRAYILDSIRHPAEVQLLRNVYQSAFTLVGVVCDESKRTERLAEKFEEGGRKNVAELMKRDSKAPQKHGQRVADAFHLSDIFLDNSENRFKDARKSVPNPEWDITDQLSRLVKIITHQEIVRPRVEETAMHAAYGGQVKSACLSRQVGAALIDRNSGIVATGTNEVPRAGGGVYPRYADDDTDTVSDHRCAYRSLPEGQTRFCANTREQNEIVNELLQELIEAGCIDESKRERSREVLRASRIGSLLEFSRAVHAELEAILNAARSAKSTKATRLFVTTFPCHYCARHIVAAGVDEVQYIEPYPKSQALKLHFDSIEVNAANWIAPSAGGDKVLFRPFRGVAPRMYTRAFLKDRDLKDDNTGDIRFGTPEWASSWDQGRVSYLQLEALLAGE